jgi:hypothetical protein
MPAWILLFKSRGLERLPALAFANVQSDVFGEPFPLSLMNVTVEWLDDFEDADHGMAELEPGSTLAVVFRPGDRTEVTLTPAEDDDHVTLTACGLPEASVVPRSAFKIVN